jgi:hypothetical protein
MFATGKAVGYILYSIDPLESFDVLLSFVN